MSALLVGYARCSTDQQDLTTQRDSLLGLGVETDRIYVDHGLTGTNRERPGLREAFAACRAGDTLVVTKLDRLARSLPDARAIADELTPGVVGVLVLLVAGLLSLPLAVYLLDDQGTENWIVPVQLLVVAVIGAGVTLALPALARVGAPTGRRALTGACWGLLASFVGVLVFWLLLSGFRGA
jgi:hypothetical protein